MELHGTMQYLNFPIQSDERHYNTSIAILGNYTLLQSDIREGMIIK